MTNDSIAYELLIPQITAFQQKEAKLYKISGIALLLIGLVVLLVSPIGGAVFLLGSGYMFYLAFSNQKRVPTLYSGTILTRNHWYHEKYQEDGGSPTISNHREFIMHIHQSRKLKPNAGWRTVNRNQTREVVVDETIYDSFYEQEEFSFILSVANELIGYMQEEGFFLMEKMEKVKGNQERRFSVAIPQTEKPLQRNWELR